ncbi:MAG: hypothetical protein PCFJNLEI_01352 [Verrucomicrobiae bacterium]|nr:hypothetical protein [Verrucomicrobiae bacterium]
MTRTAVNGFEAVAALENRLHCRYHLAMSIQEIEKVIQGLSRSEVEELQGWIQDYLEDDREMTAEFKASIERGRQDIAEGRVRVRQP